MRLSELLYSQGFGTRRLCAGLIENGLVTVRGEVLSEPATEIDVSTWPVAYTVQGQSWEYQQRAYVMLNKPAGYECSHRPGAWPSVYTLLPA
ncbi:MAG: 16S rRNA pseudouridine(516) synthase, partial [Ottowia sp.]|nr:16S rRNA pseudouridine(516) synthase [Ottowia sp.]